MTFEALYRAHVADVRRFALYLTCSHADAEDITMETFVRAWAADAPLRARSIRAYLLAIAANLHRRERRRAARWPVAEGEPADDSPGAERILAARGELGAAAARLQRLPPVDRAALLLRALHEMPYDEIAAALGLSVANAKVKVHRARVALQQDRDSQ